MIAQYKDGTDTMPLPQITREAKDRLGRHPYPPIRGILCRVEGGVLFLRGRVSSFFLKQLAQEAVRGIAGVAEVVNDVEVAG
jgi:osmotically-inducible protein OsmY